MLASANILFVIQTGRMFCVDTIHHHSDRNCIAHPLSVQLNVLQQGCFLLTHLGKIYILKPMRISERNFNHYSMILEAHIGAHLSNCTSALHVLTQLLTNSGILGIPPSSCQWNEAVYMYQMIATHNHFCCIQWLTWVEVTVQRVF